LLEKFADIGRIYLTPEDASVTRRRRKMGGNKRVKYEDGWVEFADKKKARRVAAMLNGQPIGSKNRGFYEHDLWTIKYASPPAQSPRLLAAMRHRSVVLTVTRQVPLKVQVEALDRWALGFVFSFKQLHPPQQYDVVSRYLQKN
jgi:hypothetical protein